MLDEISTLREARVQYRIDMEADHLARRYNFDQLRQQKYKRGNIPRTVDPTTGGFLWPVLIDTCVYDLDYLKAFIHDYARGRERSIT
jgi:hypothetical protein